MKSYTIPELLEIFKSHAKVAREIEIERCKNNDVEYSERFYITDALYSICEEIQNKQDVDNW